MLIELMKTLNKVTYIFSARSFSDDINIVFYAFKRLFTSNFLCFFYLLLGISSFNLALQFMLLYL